MDYITSSGVGVAGGARAGGSVGTTETAIRSGDSWECNCKLLFAPGPHIIVQDSKDNKSYIKIMSIQLNTHEY